MDQHLQEAFLRGFERGLEKSASAGILSLFPRAASAVGRWATTYKGTGLPSFGQGTNWLKRGWRTVKREAPGMAAQTGVNVASTAAMGKVFEQKPQGTPQGSMFQRGQRTLT